MKNRFLPILVLAALIAGILLLWINQRPSESKGSAEQLSRVEQEINRGLLPGPGDREATAQFLTNDPDAEAAQANGAAATDVAVSKSIKPDRVDRTASNLPGNEDSGEFVLGGLVLDEEGNPQSNFEVLAERIGHEDGAPLMVDSARENVQSIFSGFGGNFLFNNLEDGEYRVRLAPVAGIARAETRVRAGTLNASLVVVVLRDVRVHGTVKSTDGEPLEDVTIVAAPAASSTHSGSRGEYELDVNWQGRDVVYNILFQHKGFRQQRIRLKPADLDSPGGDFQLDVSMEPLERLTTVAGRLTDTKGNPVGGETIHLLTPRMRTWYHVQSGVSGNFLFEEVEPGNDYRLQIRPASRYRNKDMSHLLVPDGGLNLDIVLERIDKGELSGWMIDLDGRPIPGFSLTLRSNMATAQSVSVVGDQQGFFSVEGFPVGEALFRTNSYPDLLVQGIRVSAEPKEPVMVILDTGRYVLQGRVIDRFGVPVGQSNITLSWAFRDNRLRSSSTRKITTDRDGNFAFTGLGPDLHTMEISAAGFNTAKKTIDVGAARIEIVIELEETSQ